jgi:Mn2+/Fe2+ NRAMP family transporter
LAADAAAVSHQHGDPQPLAAALLAFDDRASSAVVAIAPERVDHLLGERTRWELPVALLVWAIVAVLAISVVTLRTAQATDHAMVSLPLVAAQLCMVMMAALPLAAGSAVLLGALRLRSAQRVGR